MSSLTCGARIHPAVPLPPTDGRGGDLVARLARELDALVSAGVALLTSASHDPLLDSALSRLGGRPVPRRAPPVLLFLPDACLPAERLLLAASGQCSPEDKPLSAAELWAAMLGELDALVSQGAALNRLVPLPDSMARAEPAAPADSDAPQASSPRATNTAGVRLAVKAGTAAALAWGARKLLPGSLRHSPATPPRRPSASAH